MREWNLRNKRGGRRITLKFQGSPRMASVDEYLRYAEQCVALAAKLSNPADKARLLQMAQAWRDLYGRRDNKQHKDPAR
jgi:hypothetical protein